MCLTVDGSRRESGTTLVFKLSRQHGSVKLVLIKEWGELVERDQVIATGCTPLQYMRPLRILQNRRYTVHPLKVWYCNLKRLVSLGSTTSLSQLPPTA